MRRHLVRAVAAFSAAAVACPLLSTPSVAAPGPTPPGAVLSRQSVLMGPQHRVSGMPSTTAPHRQIARASIVRNVYDENDWVTTHVTLAGAPPGDDRDQDATVMIGLGHLAGNNCILQAEGGTRTSGGERVVEAMYYLGPRDYNARIGDKPDRRYTCMVAWITNGTQIYDAVGAAPTNLWTAPALRIGRVEQLGARQKKLRLVPGTWTPYSVEVRNTGARAAGRIRLSGTGKHLKVRSGRSSGSLSPGQSTTVKVWVRHTGKRAKGRLNLKATTAAGVVGRRSIPVLRVKAPRRPVAGRYVGAGGDVQFRIKRGRIVGFTAAVQVRCETGSVTTQTLSFPKVKVPKSAVVLASRSGRASGSRWTTSLSLRASGKRVVRANFGYHFYTPGLAGSSCSATQPFTARRVGR